jgi:hypothetical protein
VNWTPFPVITGSAEVNASGGGHRHSRPPALIEFREAAHIKARYCIIHRHCFGERGMDEGRWYEKIAVRHEVPDVFVVVVAIVRNHVPTVAITRAMPPNVSVDAFCDEWTVVDKGTRCADCPCTFECFKGAIEALGFVGVHREQRLPSGDLVAGLDV